MVNKSFLGAGDGIRNPSRRTEGMRRAFESSRASRDLTNDYERERGDQGRRRLRQGRALRTRQVAGESAEGAGRRRKAGTCATKAGSRTAKHRRQRSRVAIIPRSDGPQGTTESLPTGGLFRSRRCVPDAANTSRAAGTQIQTDRSKENERV